ncbi:flagellar hook-associated protein FlgK [Sulfobacillus sp. hq2]|uniref:flagellar hook-associated protein FlgK n=1 Tax=Sulfobacillus TaxID=28033 RepID=UPI000CD2952D|nr:flagellar hook-associated protein FlgK [Sulfobacillus sp. hq2]POB10443.1 flagellar hook-associated protein FlgK [Sulfobacillus sp. hq2]
MSFMMLNIAGRSLSAQQLAMEVTGNNLANATTTGYHNEIANLVETPPIPSSQLNGSLQGQGVSVDAITRASNAFLARSVRTQLGTTGYWQSMNTSLSQIQNVFQEPSASGLSEAMGAFFNAWLTLSQTPSSLSARQAVIDQGKNLASTFNSMANQITGEIQNINQSVVNTVQKINTITSQIAQLNQQISAVTGAGGSANTLLDQRGTLMNQLSQLVNISYTVNPDQSVNIYLGSNALVINQTAHSLMTSAPTTANSVDQIAFHDNPSQTLNASNGLQNGELAGLLTAGNQNLPGYLTSLDALAGDLASAVNAQQEAGYTLNSATNGPIFFTSSLSSTAPVTASTIQVSSTLTSQDVAAAQNPNAPGDGSNALTIANMIYQPEISPTTGTLDTTSTGVTFNQFYTNLVGQVGNDGQQASNQFASAQNTLNSLQNAQESATGVDVNEQSAQLIQEQQSYQAAAQLVSVEQSTMASLLAAVS